MSYVGIMDGWHGDENECNGQCGLCENCEDNYYQQCDEEYDMWRDEECAA
jgi:hypothetical protein